MAEDRIIRRWGYHAKQEAKIFELKEGESLPSGWFDSPARVEVVKPKRKPKAEEAEDKSEAEAEEDLTEEDEDDEEDEED